MNAYILTETTLTVIFTDETKVTHSTNPHWDDILEAIKDEEWGSVYGMMDIAESVKQFTSGSGVTVLDGNVFFMGEPIDNSLTKRILKMMDEGFNISPMVKFLENLQHNPSKKSVDNLYRFLEHNNLPITADGHFLAYKNVRDNYMDKHSGTFDNSVGSVCEMPRNQVEDDPEQTCSAGLHFCSIEYLNGMWGHSGHTMVIKINPADVVSIPTDYNNAKGRAARYEVIAEHMDGREDTLSTSSVYGDDDDDDCVDFDLDCEDCEFSAYGEVNCTY
jgi:hypothetical protein